MEYQRNSERYALLRWAQQSFQNSGWCRRERVSSIRSISSIWRRSSRAGVGPRYRRLPDTLVGTDSHTTMINGLGVLGWGVGGIEAEAVLLGQPLYQLMPEVVGFRLTGALDPGATATDLVLHVTQICAATAWSAGLSSSSARDLAASRLPTGQRSRIWRLNTEPPPRSSRLTTKRSATSRRPGGRPTWWRPICKTQGLFRTDDTPDPSYNDVVTLELGSVVPSLAGPRRPQDGSRLATCERHSALHSPTIWARTHRRRTAIRTSVRLP